MFVMLTVRNANLWCVSAILDGAHSHTIVSCPCQATRASCTSMMDLCIREQRMTMLSIVWMTNSSMNGDDHMMG